MSLRYLTCYTTVVKLFANPSGAPIFSYLTAVGLPKLQISFGKDQSGWNTVIIHITTILPTTVLIRPCSTPVDRQDNAFSMHSHIWDQKRLACHLELIRYNVSKFERSAMIVKLFDSKYVHQCFQSSGKSVNPAWVFST